MKIAARRRMAVGVVATTSALMAGVLIAPASTAAANGLSISPNGVQNTGSVVLTFNATDADFTLGGEATFTRLGTVSTFTAEIDGGQDSPPPDDEGTSTVDFADMGDGLGVDGPGDAGVYSVSADGTEGGLIGGGNDTCTSCFTILSAGPVDVTSVAPTSLRPGASGDVSILGNNFERGSKVEFLAPGTDVVDTAINGNQLPNGTDSTPDDDGVTTRTELKRRVTVAAGASAGSRDVRVTNLDGNTDRCSACFFISGADLTSASKTSDFNDPTQALTTITFTGTAVASNPVPRLEYVGNPGSASRSQLAIPGQNVRDVSATSVTADYDLRNAAPGSNAYQPLVEGDGGVVNACTCRFTVVQRDTRTPTITSLDRSTDAGVQKSLRAGETATFTATGTNFSKGATLVFTPAAGLTVTGAEFVSPEQINVTIAAAGDTAAGDKDVQVRLTDGKTSPTADNNLLTVTPGSGASATPTASSSASPTSSATPTASASPAARADARYAGLATPVRALDTRANSGARRSGLIVLDLSQRITDPNATAAVLNVTVTNPSARGFLVAYPNGNTKPGTSNVNFEAAQTQANEVVVGLPANKRVSLFVDSASAHVIADLVGFFTTTSSSDTGRITTNAPARALDTRSTDTKTRSGEVIVDLTGRIPSGSTDAILNVTATTTSARGFVVAYPTGTTRPGTSNVNFERGQTQANEVITRVGTGANANKVSLFVDSASAALIVDVVGAVTPGTPAGTQVFTGLSQPTRALDTRANSGSRRTGNVDVAMPSSVPSNATGVVLNVTATNGTRPGFVTVFPTGSTNPGTSNVNFRTNLTQANEVVSRLGTNRSVTLFVGGANSPAAHLIVDVVGYLTGTGAASASPSASASASPSCTPGILTPCPSSSASAGPSGSATPTASGSASPTASATASATPSGSATPTASGSASPTASASPTSGGCPGGLPVC